MRSIIILVSSLLILTALAVSWEVFVSPSQEQLNVTFISDGKVLRHNLRYSGKSEPWLYKRINDVKSVLVALYDGSRLFVQYKNGKSEVLK